MTAGDGALPRVELRKRLERTIRGGHPWVYRDAVAGTPRLPDGAVVQLTTGTGRALAFGFWDARSPIAVRILAAGPGPADADARAVVAERVAAALARRLAFIDRAGTDAFRWIHGEADGLPGVHVDVYGAAASLRCDGEGARAFYRELPEQLRVAAGAAGIALRTVVERRRARRGGDGAADERAAVVLGAAPEGEIEIRENGLRFGVDLLRGQKGGLFLDQRDNRALVRTLAPGRRRAEPVRLHRWLFDLRGARAGRAATVTVDAAAPAIAAARRNFERNRLATDGAGFVAGDAFAFLERAARDGERFDIVISDPPSFAPSRRALPTGLACLPAPASPVRGGHRAGRDAVRGVVLEPRRPGHVPRHRARRRARRGPPVCAGRAARRRRRPPGRAPVSGGRLPEICRGCPMMPRIWP